MRERALSLALALIAILLFAGIFIEKKPQLSNSMASTEDQGEQGHAALFQWLKSRNVPVQSWRERWFELDKRFSAGHVLVSSFPYRMQDEKSGSWQDAPHAYVDAREKTAMLRWIAAGNTLVLPMGAFDAEGNTADARDAARRELGYFDLLQTLGWTLSGSAAGEPPVVDDDAASDEDQNESDDKSRASDTVNKSRASDTVNKSRASDTVNKSRASDTAEREAAVANARPQALHALELQLAPGLPVMQFAPIAWEPQGSLKLAFAPLDSTDECRAKAPSAADANDDANEDYQDNSVKDEVPPDSADTADSATSAAFPIDHSKDRISADGSTVNSGFCADSGMRQALTILRAPDDGSAAGWWLPFGRGGVVVIGYGSLWRNPNLAREGTAVAAESLLSNFLKPGGVLLFDDYRFGLSSIYDPNALLKDPRLYKTLGVVGIFWLLYAVGRQRRLLPVRIAQEKPSSATFARAISDFYARSLTDVELAHALISQFLNSARAHGGIRGDDTVVWARLKQNGALDRGALEHAERLSGVQAGHDNVQLTRLILQLERKLVNYTIAKESNR